MNYSKSTRALLAEAFTHALDNLAKDCFEDYQVQKSQHVCICIALAVAQKHILYSTGELAREIVMQRLAPYSSYVGWVAERVGSKALEQDSKQGSVQLQQGRRAWLESLIKEFSQ